MSASPALSALVTNVNTGGQWIVIQTITTRHGPFKGRQEAEAFAAKVEGRPDQTTQEVPA